MKKKTLHFTHRSRHLSLADCKDYPRPAEAEWHDFAAQKGFRIVHRVKDRFHLVLECTSCTAHTVHRVFTLRTAQPKCGGCQQNHRLEQAKIAGFELLNRDENNHKYAYYRLPCGHVRHLQIGRADKLAREGTADDADGYHCPICHLARQKSMAAEWGWERAGPDPKGKPNYLLLQHSPCGHRQRVATGNLTTGRFNCGGCGDAWSASPSVLYLMRFRVPKVGRIVKLGYSRNPKSRMRHQLNLRADVKAEIIDEIHMPSGQAALQVEKSLHKILMETYPDHVVARDKLKSWINVTSEIYAAELEPKIRRLLERLYEDDEEVDGG